MNKLMAALGLSAIFFLLQGRELVELGAIRPQRIQTSLNADWTYYETASTDVTTFAQAATGVAVELPHTWNQWDAVDVTPGYRRSASWYARTLSINKASDRRYLLYFEGANMKASVYLNGQFVGEHIGGYLGFELDITDHLRAEETNKLAVRVDNSYDPNLIPSQKSDFFLYGGLTRDVWLREVPATYLDQLLVQTPNVNHSRAATQVAIQIQNPSQKDENFELQLKLFDPAGTEVLSRPAESVTPTDRTQTITLDLPALEEPQLWSPSTPQLYTVQASLYQEGALVDQKETKIGYRFYQFGEEGAFYLNGKRLLLRGTHRHEEHAGYGAAVPNGQHRRDMELIKELGANFVRLGHYPQDPEVYRACDELGLIVWDELPWCRGGKGGSEWEANTMRMLQEQIQQNYNHASIFFWSLGNEIYWLPEFPGGGDSEALNAYVAKLNKEAHRLDPYRLTAIRKYYDGAHLVDVFSPSIWSGWYAGVYKNYAQSLSRERAKYPQMLHMEYGGSSHVGRHTETPVDGNGLLNPNEWEEAINQVDVNNIAQRGDWTENYIVDLFDWHLTVSETSDSLAGNAQWAFKDFGTPLRPENAIPYLNQKGLVDRSGNPKDAYYVFKSYWSEDPFVYIESHSWTERMGPRGKARELSVFSNCDSVELIHNGQSLRFRERTLGNFPAAGLTWSVSFVEGANTLLAKGFQNGRCIAEDSLQINYYFERPGRTDRIVLSASTLPNGNRLIEALAVDANGRRVLDYENRIYFSSDGPGTLLMHYGTPTRSQVIEMANGRAAIELVPGNGPTVVEARNQSFKGSYLRVE